jgi:hypothetical protein
VNPRWSHLLFALPICGALELGAELVLAARTPRPEVWNTLRPELQALAPIGTPVVVAPRWAEPHLRAELGDDWMPLAKLAHSGLEIEPRVLEISFRGHRASELSGFRELASRERGPIVVRLLENPSPEHVVFDFVDALRPGRVVVHGTEPSRVCRFQPRARVRTGGLGGHPTLPRERFECGEGPLSDVGVTVIADERFLPRRCIFAHPPASGARVLRYDAVPLGREIVLDAGMYWITERDELGAPVTLELRVDGELVDTVVHHDGDGWSRNRISLGAHAGKQRASVELRIHADDVDERHYCFRADSR